MAIPNGFPLSRERCAEILGHLGSKRIAVLGDFHLDVYWHADMQRARLSRETPHYARPVVKERYDPGVGGVIAGNLKALGVGTVIAVGASGDDWRGEVLRRRLREMGVRLDVFRAVPGRITPTYLKPLIHGYESVQEDPRLDFQDDRDLPPDAESALLADLRRLLSELDGLVVIDQVEDPTGGIVTSSVREALSGLARSRPELPILADSRARIGHFREVLVKVNRLELATALGRGPPLGPVRLLDLARELAARTSRSVIVSEGSGGMSHVGPEGYGRVPAIPVTGPTDSVGAGDSASAGLVSALACGASLPEAVALGNLVASVTVRKIGVTGTASPGEILAAYEQEGS